MRVSAERRIIPTATHLFEEPGTLEQGAGEVGRWFSDHVSSPAGLGGTGAQG